MKTLVILVVMAALAAVPATATAASSQTYAVAAIPTPPGSAGIDAAPGMNSIGQVAVAVWGGSCCDSAGLWSEGVTSLLHIDVAGCGGCGALGSSPTGINAAGQVTGSENDELDSGADTTVAFRYSPIGTVLIPGFGGTDAAGEGINGAGQVVGYANTAAGAYHAFLWDGKTTHDLGTLGGLQSEATATYGTGQAVGCAQTPTGAWHPFLYLAGAMKDLGLPPGFTFGCAISVNASGTILGYANTATDGTGSCAAWTWAANRFTILPKANGDCIVTGTVGYYVPTSSGGHIADTGQVVGQVISASGDGNLIPVVEQGGVDQILTGAVTPFDPESADDYGDDPGWYGGATTNNLHGLLVVDNPDNAAFLFTPINVSDENAKAIKYSSGWKRVKLSGAYGGQVEQAASGKTLTFSFTGKSISLIGATGPLGNATVAIDGTSHGTLSESGAATTRTRLDTIYFATPSKHTLKLTVSSGTFDLDAITVAPN